MTWTVRVFQSGTQIVTDDGGGPHFYVHAGYVGGEAYRSDVSGDLAAWMNGGPDPVWRATLRRTGADYCDGIGKIHIRATGPMRLPPNDNGALNWREVDSDAPARVALMDRLCPGAKP